MKRDLAELAMLPLLVILLVVAALVGLLLTAVVVLDNISLGLRPLYGIKDDKHGMRHL